MTNLFPKKKKTVFLILFLILTSIKHDCLQAQLIAHWNPISLTSGGPSPWLPTTSHTNVINSGWMKGSGLNSVTTNSAWGASNWMGNANQDATFYIKANPGYSLSLSTFTLWYRRSSTGPSTGTLMYTFNSSTNYTQIAVYNYTSVASGGAVSPSVDLSGISALQSVSPADTIKFRLYNVTTSTSTSGTWYIYGNGAALTGSIIPVTSSGLSASIAQTDTIKCNGQTIGALTCSVSGSTGPYTYSWSPVGGTSALATGLGAGTYTCFVTSATSETAVATYTLNQPPGLSLNVLTQSSVSCYGGSDGSASVASTGGTPSYAYSWAPSGGTASSSNSLVAGNYTVTVTDSKSCTASVSLVVNAPLSALVVSGVASSTLVCEGSSVTLTGSGASTYGWSGAVSDNVAFSPIASSVYTVTGIDTNGCSDTATVSITVNPLPTITVNSGSICSGSSFVMVPSGANTYSFSGGSATVSPGSTSSYSVYGTNIQGCNVATPAVANVWVTTTPTVTISGNSNICSGDTANLSAAGALSYSWSTGESNNSIAPNPSVNTTYSVTGTSGSCSDTAITVLDVNPTPTITVSGGAICPGNTFVLVQGGATTYTFSSGTATVSPSVTTTYSITGTSNAGCVSEMPGVATVTVVNTLTVSISGPNNVCPGGVAGFTASGAGSYSWSSGETSNIITSIPTVSTIYTVTGTSGSCSDTAVITINIYNLPVVSVAGTSVMCEGNTATISVGGAALYSWNTGASMDTIVVSPTANSTYTVIGTDANSCTNTAVWSVTVNPAPVITAASGSVCEGTSYAFNPSGADTYTFSGGATVSPSVTTTYSVTGTSSLGCMSLVAAMPTVSVYSLPVINVNSGSICLGSSLTLVPSGAVTYTINGGGTFVVSPTVTSSYSVTGTNVAGCISSLAAVSNITVNSLPLVNVNSGAVCAGAVFTISPSGAATYTFSNGSSTVAPSVNSSFSVSGTSSLGCVSASPAVSNITVNSLPLVNVNSGAVCAGAVFTISPSGAATYTYSNGSSTVAPSVNSSFSVSGTSSLGCVSASPAVSNITVNPLPLVNVNSGAVCAGAVFTISPSGAATYTYSNGSSTVAPSVNSSFSVSGTSSLGCVSASPAVSNITVNSLPLVNVNSGAVCAGAVFTISPSGAATYTFSNGSSTVAPSVNSSFSVSGTSSLGCVSASPAVSNITVNPLPLVNVNSGAVCVGAVFTISPSGATTYTYSNGSSTVAPSVNSSFSVSGTSSLGCVSASPAVSNITVNPLPLVNVNSGAVCAGAVFTISPSGAATYTYSNGSSTVAPSVNSSFSVSGTSSLGCVSASPAVSNITVNPLPVISVGSGSICAGLSFTLVPSGATTYIFSSGSAVVAPSITTSYSVSGTSAAGCVSGSMAAVTITVISLPQVAIQGSTILCSGQSASFTASGANNYTWDSGATSATIAPTPIVNSSYTVVGTTGACSNWAVIMVSVMPTPSVSVVSSSSAICFGNSATLTASGANTYSWNTGATASVAVVSPTSNTSYTVTGISSTGCQGTVSILQNVLLCTSLHNVINNDAVKLIVFPNPNNGEFTVKSDVALSIFVANSVGQTVRVIELDGQESKQQYVKELAAGVYFISAHYQGARIIQKIIVTK